MNVAPASSDPEEPNAGQWFFTEIAPGQTVRLEAKITNPAFVEQTVTLFFADMSFGDDGAPQVIEPPRDVGTWGRFEDDTATVPPRRSIVVPFFLTAPQDPEPGDHVGAVIAQHAPVGDGPIGIVKRVATRLYATIPGDAQREFVIDHVKVEPDSAFYAQEVTVTVQLRNTGRVRLEPTVTVDGARAKGSELLLSQSVERYVVSRPVSFWGGLLRFRVDAETRSLTGVAGPARQVRVSKFIFPWHLLVLLALGVGLFFAGRWVWRKRGSKYEALQSDIRRLERLLSGGAPGDADQALPGNKDPATAIRGAIKQARRAGDEKTARRLEAKLDEVEGKAPEEVLSAEASGASALAAILREIGEAPPKRQGALIQAARAYGVKELRKHEAVIDGLPEEVRVRLLSKKSPSKPSGKRRGPAKREK